jgi:disulfide bond formation protein DsbB
MQLRKISSTHLLVFVFFAAAFALISAYISQFYFGLEPCQLCLYQRKPFFAILALISLTPFFFKSESARKKILFCCAIFLFINCGIAIYHVGVEQKIFQGLSGCSSSTALDDIDNLESLKTALLNTKAIRCDVPAFVFLGLSMAAWNAIYCALLLIILALYNIRIRKR